MIQIDITIPKSCYECPIANEDGFYLCKANGHYLEDDCCDRRPQWCPLKEIDRPQGEWSIDSVYEIELSHGGMAYEPVYKCSHCGMKTESYVRFDKPLMPEDADFPNFCGWCGAKMKGASDGI